MHQFFFAFGEFDGVSIVEFPNNESCACMRLRNASWHSLSKTFLILFKGRSSAHPFYQITFADASAPSFFFLLPLAAPFRLLAVFTAAAARLPPLRPIKNSSIE